LGAGVWSTPAVDQESNSAYVTTGTGGQDAHRGLWGGTLLALDASTLEIQPAYFFLPTNSLELDIEWGSSPTLFTLPHGTRMVAAAGKDGVLYALDRHNLPWPGRPPWRSGASARNVDAARSPRQLSTASVSTWAPAQLKTTSTLTNLARSMPSTPPPAG
jgi:glucose dehydrogenase